MAFFLIGLGNPGKDYARNRHNIGFMAVDAIAGAYNFSPWKKAFGGMIAEGAIARKKGFLFKPMSYMNLSGEPSVQAVNFYKILPAVITVLHDELDLPLGKLRVKTGGGHGGHNGLKSLDAHLTPEYKRVRIGIGHPGDKDLVSDYVLGNFTKAEAPVVEELIASITRHIDLLLANDDAAFMSKIALEMKEE